MSRGVASVIVLILILILTAFFFFSPSLLSNKDTKSPDLLREVMVQRFTSLGYSIAHASFVEDAVIMGEEANLSEIISRLQRDEPELTFVHITDTNHVVLASSDSTMVGRTYNSNILAVGSNAVREQNGKYDGGFSINVGTKRVGALYFSANPRVPTIHLSNDRNAIVVVLGVVCAFVAFLVTLISRRSLKARLIDELNRRQEKLFSPKIEALKQAQKDAQNKLNEMNDEIKNSEQTLQKCTEEYESRKKEAESDPLVQSVEKLKADEDKLSSHLGELKEAEAQLNAEINSLSQKREEVLNALESDRKEERTLHEKLDLIKKKILHLETPGK
jgi:prefoldin subunit 5